jgi:hypothetical protein
MDWRKLPDKKGIFLLLARTGLDAEGRRSGLASSVVAIRLRVAGEFASQIRRNRDVVPLDASIRRCPIQTGIGQDSGWLDAIGMGIPLGDESLGEGHSR